jgi:DNA-binding HxlR family transcriptional regulator
VICANPAGSVSHGDFRGDCGLGAPCIGRIFLERNSEPGEENDPAAARIPAPSGQQPASGMDWDGVDWERVEEVLGAVTGVWMVPILRTLASGVSRPTDLLRVINAESGGRLNRKVMYETLHRMVQDGLVSRVEVEGSIPRRTDYWPTHDKGHVILNRLSKLGAPDSAKARWLVMGSEAPPAPSGVDTSRPNAARVWNALLGGKDNYEADRLAMQAFLAEMPSLPEAARLARRFQADAIDRLVTEHGVRQFLDIGTGLPSAGAVHETAQRIAPESRVVYVDNDPQVLVHARALLRGSLPESTAVVGADIREPDRILAQAAETLDLKLPVAVITMMILHFIRG